MPGTSSTKRQGGGGINGPFFYTFVHIPNPSRIHNLPSTPQQGGVIKVKLITPEVARKRRERRQLIENVTRLLMYLTPILLLLFFVIVVSFLQGTQLPSTQGGI